MDRYGTYGLSPSRLRDDILRQSICQEKMEKGKRVGSLLTYHPSICLVKLKKLLKNVSQNSQEQCSNTSTPTLSISNPLLCMKPCLINCVWFGLFLVTIHFGSSLLFECNALKSTCFYA